MQPILKSIISRLFFSYLVSQPDYAEASTLETQNFYQSVHSTCNQLTFVLPLEFYYPMFSPVIDKLKITQLTQQVESTAREWMLETYCKEYIAQDQDKNMLQILQKNLFSKPF